MALEKSFYVTGGTLPRTAECYVTRSADTELFEGVRSREYVYVLDARQMGKSSLSVRVVQRLADSGVRTAFLDLTRYGIDNLSPDQWFASMLRDLDRSLKMTGEMFRYWQENASLSPVRRFFGAIVEVALNRIEGDIAVFVDEIDATRSLPFRADEFFIAIRECFIGRATDPRLERLTFVLFGAASPAEIIQDARVSPFNIGRRVRLEDFAFEDTAVLAKHLPGDSQAKMRRVLYWTGGHPYLTQRMCQAISGMGPEADVDRVCHDLFLDYRSQNSDDNLAFVRNRILKSDVDLVGLLEMYSAIRSGKVVPDAPSNPLCTVLKMSGIARERNGRLKVRNPIYGRVFDGEWIRDQLPDAELRRQKAAYRRGLIRAGLVVSSVVLIVAALAVAAIVEAGREHAAFVREKILLASVVSNNKGARNMSKELHEQFDKMQAQIASDKRQIAEDRQQMRRDESEIARLRANPSKPRF
jgi:hypothetical protein